MRSQTSAGALGNTLNQHEELSFQRGMDSRVSQEVERTRNCGALFCLLFPALGQHSPHLCGYTKFRLSLGHTWALAIGNLGPHFRCVKPFPYQLPCEYLDIVNHGHREMVFTRTHLCSNKPKGEYVGLFGVLPVPGDLWRCPSRIVGTAPIGIRFRFFVVYKWSETDV